MIPETLEDLNELTGEAARQTAELEALFSAYGRDVLLRRPDESKWSAAGHVAHLCLVNEPYLAAIRERIAQARERGESESSGPYRHPWFARWFVGAQEPPPKRRLKTFKSMVPDPTLDAEDVLQRFRSIQEGFVAALAEARGLDLGRIRFRSPLLALVRLSLGTGFELVLAHNRRHIWLIREVLGKVGTAGGGHHGRER